MSSPQNCSAVSGTPASTAAHRPTRTDRRTIARIARAEGLRGQRRNRRHQPHAEREGDEQYRVAERGRGHHVIAEPAEQRQIGRHHGDLAELGHGQRRRQLQVSPNSARQSASRRRRTRPAVAMVCDAVMAAT